MELLVETKKEYTTLLVKTFSPLIYEGLMSIYNRAKNISNDQRILKIFQGFLKDVPQWTRNIINTETNRILSNSGCSEWLSNLMKATLKANLIIMSYSPFSNKEINIDRKDYEDVQLENFVHNIYIECAREIWNNPYLFYHNYPPIDIKRNQRDIIQLINEAIKEALRKMLPVKKILESYLNNDISKREIGEKMSMENSQKLNKIIKNDLESQNSYPIDKFLKNNSDSKNKTDDTNAKLLSIINKQKVPLSTLKSEKNTLPLLENKKLSVENKENKMTPRNKNNYSSTSVSSFNKNTQLSTTSDSEKIEDIDSKIKNILKKDLGDEELTETVSQVIKGGDYEDIFSNSITDKKISMNMPKVVDNNVKNKFFANYLKV